MPNLPAVRPAENRAYVRCFCERLLVTATFLCQAAWQGASRLQRSRYPRYELSGREFRDARRKREDGEGAGGCFVEGVAALSLIHPMIGLVMEERDGDLSDARAAGTVLRAASFAGCALGNPASPGDVLDLLGDLKGRRYRLGDEEFGADEVRAAYRNGQRKLLLMLLNVSFARACGLREEFMRTGDGEEPVPFRYSAARRSIELDEPALHIGFDYYRSILALLESDAGHC